MLNFQAADQAKLHEFVGRWQPDVIVVGSCDMRCRTLKCQLEKLVNYCQTTGALPRQIDVLIADQVLLPIRSEMYPSPSNTCSSPSHRMSVTPFVIYSISTHKCCACGRSLLHPGAHGRSLSRRIAGLWMRRLQVISCPRQAFVAQYW